MQASAKALAVVDKVCVGFFFKFLHVYRSWDSSVAVGWMAGVQYLAGVGDFSLHHGIQIVS